MSTIHPLETETPTPTVTHYQEVAAQLRKALNDAQALIPAFAPAHPATKELVRKYQSFPDTLIGTAIAAVEGAPSSSASGRSTSSKRATCSSSSKPSAPASIRRTCCCAT